jgi:hypothetical protein
MFFLIKKRFLILGEGTLQILGVEAGEGGWIWKKT